MGLLPALGRRARSTWHLLLRELGAFGAVGASCFALDVALFQLLYGSGTGAVTAKLASTLVSTSVAYLGHRFWSFAHRERTGYRREYVAFVLVNGLTLLLGLAVVAVVRHPLGQEHALVLQAANVASICLGTVVRWFAYRRWVFPPKQAPAAGTTPEQGRPHTGVVRRLPGTDPATTGA
ncbi:Putative flippase GtrA (transmembrane translocase of bactoprenol-linked glucose) [Geodermatophilus telluris]|uniref:Putative flippase GtrA (Transmembrane translocase of bactoprenol-linked glucose) n=1 Tax=Geodermatophilus telluris TaxID=1190417 RepID=A0A1G6IKN3_9ACTN|nr:GtrA family protein [Geodermatophilus telluris]SDC06565.1 Putative flippase GtrA (transmembrane translocase of bactoprenol-linked glucose) [Geodermatophilus telluris]